MFTKMQIYQSKMLIFFILIAFSSVAVTSCASKKSASGDSKVVAGPTISDNNAQAKNKETTASSDQNTKEHKVHIVAEGETLSIIAKKYNVPLDAIVKLNNIADVNFIKVGQKILIPEPDSGEKK
jgi:LysM repeat protein